MMKKIGVLFLASTAVVAVFCVPCATAGIADDLANAIIIEEFLFDDIAGTMIPDAANNAGTGHLFDADSDSDPVATNGFGQLNVSLKDNNSFGTHYVDNDDITSGRVLGIMELTWDFDVNVFDPAEDEELRITLINNPPRGTQVTAEVEIQRDDFTVLNITGAATNGDSLGPMALNISQTAKFIAVVDANLDTDMYSVHFSADAGANFTTIGTGAIDPTRGVAALRMVLNENFVGDNVLIDRVALAVVPEPQAAVLVMMALMGLAVGRKQRPRC